MICNESDREILSKYHVHHRKLKIRIQFAEQKFNQFIICLTGCGMSMRKVCFLDCSICIWSSLQGIAAWLLFTKPALSCETVYIEISVKQHLPRFNRLGLLERSTKMNSYQFWLPRGFFCAELLKIFAIAVHYSSSRISSKIKIVLLRYKSVFLRRSVTMRNFYSI